MRSKIIAMSIGAALLLLVVNTDFSMELPVKPEPVSTSTLEFNPIWHPLVTTDCEVWEISQRDAAKEDIFHHAQYMTVDGEGQFGPDDVITIEVAGPLDVELEYWDDTQVVYQLGLLATTQERC